MGGFTQKDFADLHGLDASYLSQLLNGHRRLGERAAANLEEKIGLSRGVLVSPVDDENPSGPTAIAQKATVLAALASPRSQAALAKIAQAAESGRLTEQDVLLLEALAERIAAPKHPDPATTSSSEGNKVSMRGRFKDKLSSGNSDAK